ncbi:MAG TPA: hypothetical protein VNW47_07620 [Terriglobales bacterium]|jgi:uncharacterized membrane protein (DUF2068 family)|nr:hypothetical protein [Terriglobales bacterium]
MRPLGVTLIGIYQILRGILGGLFGLSLLLFTSLAAKLASLAAEGNALERILHSFGRMAGLGIVIFGALHILAGFGLLKMENWGRLLALLFSAIGLMVLLPVLIASHGLPLIFAGINAASIFYLALPPIKRIFHGERPALSAA